MATTAEPRDLATIAREMKKIQDDHRGKPMPQNVGEQFDALAADYREIKESNAREAMVREIDAYARETPNAILPGAPGEQKAAPRGAPDEIVGTVSLGEAFVHSPELKRYIDAGMPEGGSQSLVAAVKSGRLPVTRGMLEAKAVPTLASLVIPRDRIADMVRNVEQDRLTIRDVLNVSQTNAPSVEYVTFTPTRAATPVADSAAKPEATLAMDLATAPVRTLAVWEPVTEQMLQDLPAVQNTIDTELRYDIKRLEEDQILWGAGTGQNLLGIFNTSGVTAARAVNGDTLVDSIRRAMTDIAVANLTANAVVLHPIDNENVKLTKGTDGHYLNLVFPTVDGTDRVWSLRIVESVALQKPTIGGGHTTYERRFLVGDFVRGATLWDRMQTAVAIGWKNDDFIKNLRTIRVEERLAFGVKRPLAFKYGVTVTEA